MPWFDSHQWIVRFEVFMPMKLAPWAPPAVRPLFVLRYPVVCPIGFCHPSVWPIRHFGELIRQQPSTARGVRFKQLQHWITATTVFNAEPSFANCSHVTRPV
jgi:hypothetical protein